MNEDNITLEIVCFTIPTEEPRPTTAAAKWR